MLPRIAGLVLPGLKAALLLAAFAAAIWLTYWLGIEYYFGSENVATIWLANGLVWGVLLQVRYRYWAPVILIAFGVQLVLNLEFSLSFALIVTAINCLTPALGALGLRWLCGGKLHLHYLRHTAYLILAVVLFEGLNALAGAAAVVSHYELALFWPAFQVWWFSTAIGSLLMAAVIVGWAQVEKWRVWNLKSAASIEVCLLFLSALTLGHLVFGASSQEFDLILEYPYVIFPFLLWAALRFRPVIPLTLLLFENLLLVYHADFGRGPFITAQQTTLELVLSIQAFLVVTTATTLILSALIEERRQAGLNLRESERQYRNLFKTMAQGVVYQNAEGKITSANEAALRILGLSLDQLKGRTSLDPRWRVVHEDGSEFPGDQHPAMAALRTGQPVDDIAMGVFHPIENQMKWLVVSAQPEFRPGDQAPIGVFTTFTDITARKQAESDRIKLEEQLRQTQKLEAIGTLAGGIAHDFNNVLFAIMGNAELAADTIPDDNPASEHVREVMSAGHRAAQLVNQILTFARKQAKQPAALNVASVVVETIRMLRSTLPSTIKINYESKAENPFVLADPTEIHQVVMNLSTNAGYAMSETGGDLSITIAEFEISTTNQQQYQLASGWYLEIIVADTGPGIDAAVLDHIFEPFFTTKEPGEGTGMGLAVVHGIIHDLAGQITVKSDPGCGTEFRILLPLLTSRQSDQLPSEELPLTGSAHVLVIDDDPMVSKVVTSILEELGYTVSKYGSSTEGLRAFLEAPDDFDVVLTDQTMPGVTGAELAARILENYPDQPIILCTGYSQTMSEEQAARLGISAFLQKPITKRELAAVLHHIMH